jgi:geranylgeranyl diphosphate synthase type I
VFSDLRSRKKTLPVTYALTHGGSARRELAKWFAESGAAGPHAGGEAWAADLIEAAGGRNWAVAEARYRVAAAEQTLATVPIVGGPREELIAIAHFIIAREA